MKEKLLDFDIIDFSESEIGLFDPLIHPLASTNGDSFLCCFSFHFHIDSK